MINIDDLVEVKLKDTDSFLKVRETLTRIGISSKTSNTLYQSCHILHKQQRYFIVHFKELFALDNKPTNFTDDDVRRRNTIVQFLEDWKLVTIVDANKIKEKLPTNQIKVIPYKDKPQWELCSKYTIGKK